MLLAGALLGLVFLGWALDFMEDDGPREGADEGNRLPNPGGATPSPPGLSLTGTSDGDWLAGGDGDDHLIGEEGDDDLFGGLGHDTLDGGPGNDWLVGDGDYGPGGNDLLIGRTGDDYLAGNGGNDSLHGGPGNDSLFGGEGDDLLSAGPGNDWLFGGPGNDTLIAGPGENDLTGGEGDDLLIGSADGGQSWMHGGDGDDTLVLYANDFGEGGAGADRFVLPHDPVRDPDLDLPPDAAAPPVIADYDPQEDRIELRLPADLPDPVISLRRDDEGMAVIMLDGIPVGRVIGDLEMDALILSRAAPA